MFSILWERFAEQPRLQDVNRRSACVSFEEYVHQLLPAGRPVLFETVGRWQTNTIEQLRDCAAATCEGETVAVRQSRYETPGDYTAAREKIDVGLVEYLNELADASAGANELGYAGNVRLPDSLIEAIGVRPPFAARYDNLFEPPAAWVGPPRSQTPLHKDSTDNFIFQIIGQKEWLLFPVCDVGRLGLKRIYDDEAIDFAVSDLTYEELIETAPPLVLTTKPGDMLYLPAGWSHFVMNLDVSIAINYWFGRDAFREILLQPPPFDVQRDPVR